MLSHRVVIQSTFSSLSVMAVITSIDETEISLRFERDCVQDECPGIAHLATAFMKIMLPVRSRSFRLVCSFVVKIA
eukprot:2001133-Pleurochrysis_carterae.AAC.1